MSDVQTVVPQNGHAANNAVVMTPAYQPANIAMPIIALDMAIQRRKMVLQYIEAMFVDGVDFHVIPGTDREGQPPKKVLSKAGAENLCSFFGLRPEFTVMESTYDWTGEQHNGELFFYTRYKCRLLKNDEVMGDGEGSCNSWESKYRYRWVSADAAKQYGLDPATLAKRGDFLIEPEFAINKAETGGKYGKPAEYWQAFKTAIDNGTATKTSRKKKDGGEMVAWQIGGFVYRVPNPEIADIINTVEKMAQKRALIAAVLIATGISGSFTQDLDDFMTANVTPTVIVEEPAQTTTQPTTPAAPKPDATKPEPTKPAAETPKQDAPPPQRDMKAESNALIARITVLAKRSNLDPKAFQKNCLGPYWCGFFNKAPKDLPTDPALYDANMKALEALDDEGVKKFMANPYEFGKGLVAAAAQTVVGTVTPAPAATTSNDEINVLLEKVSKLRGLTVEALWQHIVTVGLQNAAPPDIRAYLVLCTATKVAKLAVTAAKSRGVTVAEILAMVEAKAGFQITDGCDTHAVETALATVAGGD